MIISRIYAGLMEGVFMNLPNKLTVLRVILVPFFVVFLLLSKTTESMKWIALVLFIVASLTDFLDGYLARSRNLVTTFGKFMDPLADKVLTISGMICLIELGRIPSWIVVIIVAREFIISGFRLIATEHGIVIAANYWGKWKTTFQMIMIILMIVNIPALKMVTTSFFVGIGTGPLTLDPVFFTVSMILFADASIK